MPFHSYSARRRYSRRNQNYGSIFIANVTILEQDGGKYYTIKTKYNPTLITAYKLIPVSDRSFDEITKEWTVTEKYWPTIEKLLQGLGYGISYKDKDPELSPEEQAKYKKLIEEADKQHVIQAKPAETLEALQLKFYALVPAELKGLSLQLAYRKAAFLYHPDRNGDADKMAELNVLYSKIKSLGGLV